MARGRKLAMAALLLSALAGCKHKNNTTPAPQAQAPAITQPAPSTEPAQPATPPAETNPPANPPSTTEEAPAPKPTAPKPRPHRPTSTTSATHKPTTTQPAQKPANASPTPSTPQSGTPQAAVQPAPAVPNPTTPGNATTADIKPGTMADQELHTRGSTDQLLQATEGNLRRLNRQLKPAEQKMVDEIKNYMQRARSAQTDGDVNLAHNYALKAHQLSDVLISQ